jgi:hypothetical protein
LSRKPICHWFFISAWLLKLSGRGVALLLVYGLLRAHRINPANAITLILAPHGCRND